MIMETITTVRNSGKSIGNQPIFLLTVPNSLVRQFETNGEKLEHLDQVFITMRKTGTKGVSKPWAFKRKAEQGEANGNNTKDN